MKRSELKQLIREVIEEISANKDLDLYSADAEFEFHVDLENGASDVPVHIYAFHAPSMYDFVAIATEDATDDGTPNGQVLVRKGTDVTNDLTKASFDNLYREIEKAM